MDVGSNLQWSTASTITSWHHFHLTVTKNIQNLIQLWQCNDVRVHVYTCIPLWKGKNTLHMSNVFVESSQRWTTGSTMASWHHFHLIVTENCWKLTRPQQCNSVRVHLYACMPHWKGLKHLIHIQFACEKQSKVVYTLNHDIMASYPPSHPELPKSDPASAAY